MEQQGKNFWEVTAWSIEQYKKEGNEERVQGLVDARIIYNRFKNEKILTPELLNLLLDFREDQEILFANVNDIRQWLVGKGYKTKGL